MTRPRLLPLLLLASVALADDPPAGTLRIDTQVVLRPNGDATTHVVYRFHPQDYAEKKTSTPDARAYLRSMSSLRSDHELAPDAVSKYDDPKTSVVIDFTELGAVKYGGEGKWQLAVDPGPEFITSKEEGDRTFFYFYQIKDGAGTFPTRGQLIYACPPGAKDALFDPAGRKIRYTLEVPDTGKPGRLAVDLRAKARLMTCIYKVYGLGTDFSAMWVAKAILRNTGEGRVKDVRLRYRLEGYSEWSMWQKVPEVVPGQSVISVWYPVLDKSIAAIRTTTPSNLDMEWKYDDGTGREKEDNDSKRIVLLGVNEFVFSSLASGEKAESWQDGVNNAPYLAAWVSRDDPAVKQFAAMANKNAGGVGSGESDENAVRVLHAMYDLMRANDFTYQHPPALVDKSISFDVQNVQNVKFPRDVIRDKSGTCIDLAICYASMAHAIGLHPHLALVPGHCFPVVDLPSGGLMPVETTGVAGGVRFGSADFDKVVEFGKKELDDARQDGRLLLIDVRDFWTRGVANPELEALPPDILAKWGIKEGDPLAAGDAGAKPVAIDGAWSGTGVCKDDTGTETRTPMEFSIDAAEGGRYKVTLRIVNELTEGGKTTKYQVEEQLDGEIQDNALVLTGTKAVRTNMSTGESEDLSLDKGTLRLEDGKLVGKVGNDEDGWTDVTLDRKQ